MTRLSLWTCVIVSMMAGVPAVAHHSFAAQYDREKPITLTGTVSKVEWMNPHVYFDIDVKQGDRVTT